MQEQFDGTAELATLETVRPLGWQAAVFGEYERSWPIRHADLRARHTGRKWGLDKRRTTLDREVIALIGGFGTGKSKSYRACGCSASR